MLPVETAFVKSSIWTRVDVSVFVVNAPNKPEKEIYLRSSPITFYTIRKNIIKNKNTLLFIKQKTLQMDRESEMDGELLNVVFS